MTGPAARGTERGTRAPSRLTGTQGAVGAVLVVLALGLALRLIIAYLLPGSGFGVDLTAFRFWASDLAAHGPHGFYQRDFFHDYTPGYLYVLWLLGIVGQVIGGVGVALIKVPAILADLAIGWLVWSMILELGGRRNLALAAAFVAVVNPISWFDSVAWGQVDSVGVVFLLLGLRDLWRDRPERAAIFTVIAALIKPQLGILIPIVALVTIRRAIWPVRGAEPEGETDADVRIGIRARFLAWERRTDHPVRIVTDRRHLRAPLIRQHPRGGPIAATDVTHPVAGSERRFIGDEFLELVPGLHRPAVPALRTLRHRVRTPGAVHLLRPAGPDLRHGVGLPGPDGQHVQPVGTRHR